jgi:hypothetical protein
MGTGERADAAEWLGVWGDAHVPGEPYLEFFEDQARGGRSAGRPPTSVERVETR